MIQTNNLSLAFGDQIVFDNISFTLNQDDRVGLVGRNGSGKSTLLKAIAGQQHLDSGKVSISNKKVVAYMPQEVVLESEKSILEETLTASASLVKIQEEIAALEHHLSLDHATADLERYADLQAELCELNPALVKAQAQEILIGLGFSEAQLATTVNTLSVGWKMRIVLAKLLLQKADFYLFDEPTNHLDIVAKDWFLEFLKTSDFGYLLVSHERYFLDYLCEKILEIERGKATFYNGNYSKYVVQKEHNLEILESAYIQQQKELKQKMATIERFRASAARAKSAQSMLKSVEKLDLITMPPAMKTMKFNFPPVQQSGKVVLEVDGLAHSFGDKKIFSNASFQIERGEKVAIVAPNGVGKTTLFNIIIGQIPKQTGTITLGYNVIPTIFAQDQNKSLDGSKNIIENLHNACPKKSEGTLRSFLGSFLFTSDDVYKKINVLSGGEKNRVGMACVLLQDANLLLLDEPTNHLDIQSKEILLTALNAFQGTILFVSHDHDFINKLATRIIELTPSGTHGYLGNYESYLYQKKHETSAAPKAKSAFANLAAVAEAPKKPAGNQYEIKKLTRKLELKIAKLEKDIAAVEETFSNLTYGSQNFITTQENLNKLKAELKDAAHAWEELHK
ncbi:MAG: ABC-F family ATP-binding cassette domain-containing protein [Candidatus Dependentiae bacterium]|nr:ABC-F family ATP-binding cassette domain-containing protein [Candidatus Dependentiae bacterium]